MIRDMGVRVVVVDDDALVRRALTQFLTEGEDIDVVATAADGREACEIVDRFVPDIVVMDVRMPEMDGEEATSRITRKWPDTRVIAMTSLGAADDILPLFEAGATGYLLKDSEPESIRVAVRTAHQGTSVLSSDVVMALVASARAGRSPGAALSADQELTGRELEVVEHLARGLSNNEIARELRIGERTVKAHLSSIMLKWDLRDRVQVLIKACRVGIVTI